MAKRTTKNTQINADIRHVTRHITREVTAMLWGRAAGRCEFNGCNIALWKSPVTGENLNWAERAHIYSFSEHGPRGNAEIEKANLNKIENLILACPGCHKNIDKEITGGRYTAELLRKWKNAHEARVETVTGIDPSRKSHVLLYGSNIGNQNVYLNHADAAIAMFPEWYPATEHPLSLQLVGSVARDDTSRFYDIESTNLIGAFNEQIRDRVRNNSIEHISVFALATQPLLILLGTLLHNISKVEVYQRHREPKQTWEWCEHEKPLELKIIKPKSTKGIPALVVALSGQVEDRRVEEVLGNEVSVWKLCAENPSMDLIKSRDQLSEFRNAIRDLLGEIQSVHGLDTMLHIFPVMGVSAAVELGRVRMPKASMPWTVYDQLSGRGFVQAIKVPQEDAQ